MAKLRIWNKNERKTTEEKDIDPNTVYGVARYTLRGPNGPKDGCSLTLKDDKGGPGVRVLSEDNYNNVCHRFGIEAAGHSAKAAATAKTNELNRGLDRITSSKT